MCCSGLNSMLKDMTTFRKQSLEISRFVTLVKEVKGASRKYILQLVEISRLEKCNETKDGAAGSKEGWDTPERTLSALKKVQC